MGVGYLCTAPYKLRNFVINLVVNPSLLIKQSITTFNFSLAYDKLRVRYGSRISGLSEFNLNELKSYYSNAEN